MMQASVRAFDVDHIGELVMHRSRAHPRTDLSLAFVIAHLLTQLKAEQILREFAIGLYIACEQRQMIDATHANSAPGVLLRQIL